METLTIEQIKAKIDSLESDSLINNGSPSGVFGYYVDLGDGIGCKVQRDKYNAEGEFAHLETVESSGITPKPYAIKEVSINGKKRYAIFMEHIDGDRLRNVGYSEDEYDRIREEVNDIFREYGIRHGDLHPGNIMITDEDTMAYKIIDFSPEYIYDASDYDEINGCSLSESSSGTPESEETPVSELKQNPAQMQFDFMENVEKTWVKITYHLVTYTLGYRMLTEVFKNKKLALEQLENSLGYDLQNGLLQNAYEILPVYTHEKFRN